jgi:chromosome segregation ATPase
MKVAVALCLLLSASAAATEQSPVTRVVELLKGLSEKIEKEGKAEEDLYESFVCWGKSVIEQKTASNAASSNKIDELETYISDLNAGRIELTGERADLEKEVAELMSDLEQAKALREKENADFEDAKAEMTQAITALKSAMDVLDEATKDHKEGVLMAVHSRLSHGMEALSQQQSNLKHAVMLGDRFLDKADATFLRRLLTGDVPKRADQKKLNRKATFKMAYKARSFKIQDVLKKMHQTFNINLEDATQKEADAQASYDELSKSKGEQLSVAQDALTKSDAENGARGKSKEDAQSELDTLKKEVAADKKFIAQTEADLNTKKKQWKVRSDLRSGELAAISKAISILYSDDARDNFKKSFASQESFFFLQEGQQLSSSAASILRSAARKTGDSRLLSLAKLVAAQPSAKKKFAPIIAAIDKMIGVLKGEEEDDLKIKDECEKGRMEDTREAALAARDIDDMTDAITKLGQEIEQISQNIADMEAQTEQIKKELKEAADLRKKENLEWQTSSKEDEEAAETVLSARDVLENFYKDNKLVFVQKAAAPEVVAGEAPPPPPATWEGDYGGATGESMGIVSVLDMIHEDILKDRSKAKAEEDDAQSKFDAFKKDSEAEIKSLAEEISSQKGLKGEKETAVTKTEDERRTKKGALNAVLEKMEKINPNCEYFTVNYKLRAANRQIELDGLIKSKAILQGGNFDMPDPNREIKPGDAFLQRRA